MVALKILPKHNIMQMKHTDHVINEREVLSYLMSHRSPYIMQFYSSFQDNANLYLELEYIPGCTLLSQILGTNEVVRSRCDFYAAEAILALSHMHEQNIIYRDLKPENIMLSKTREGHLQFVDFGFSKKMKVAKTHTKCGTIVYIAPEILVGSGHDHRVDIWSLGVLICELMSGTTPFQAQSTMQVYEKIINGMPTFNR